MTDPASEAFGNFPHAAETFGTLPKVSAQFGTAQHAAEKTEHHTVTVREAAKQFEMAGVTRTERSIINWCTVNKQGVSRLDCYYDPNEHRYFITPQSVERAIGEELAKAKATDQSAHGSEGFGTTPSSSEANGKAPDPKREREEDMSGEEQVLRQRFKELEAENLDLKITNKGKDFLITQLKEDRSHFVEERQTLIGQLIETTHRMGVLETQLLQAPRPAHEASPRTSESNNDDNVSLL